MTLRKFGVGEILPEEEDEATHKTASVQDKARSIAEVIEEQQKAAEKG